MKHALILSPGADTGGQGARIKSAFDRHSETWAVRAMRRSDNYIRFPRDLKWDDALARELYASADVVQHQTNLSLVDTFGGGKPTVIHWQGSYLRDNPPRAMAEVERHGARQLVSTVDLLECAPGAEWLPSPFDLGALAYYKNSRGVGKARPFIIAHAPTNRDVKGTAAIISAVDVLKATGYNVELDLIENYQWKVCLSRKGRAHVFVDQLHLGYGNNAIEAWAMDIPVVCGVDSPEVRARMRETWGSLPFVEADAENLAQKLAGLIDSTPRRAYWGRRGREHVETFHAEAKVVRQLETLWEGMLDHGDA